MANVTPHLLVLLLAACVLGPLLLVSRVRSRRRQEALASQWTWLLREQEAHHGAGTRMLRVANVYQRGKRGSKAVVHWCDSGDTHDAWFEGWHVPPGAFVLVTGGVGVGWGPHNRIENVLYIEPRHVRGWVPFTAPGAWQRQQSRNAGTNR
ncbi:hypothetical protein [Streptomyces sp. NRRL WC-3742]|uniref:hypothetical protein n=1 Tax=Streptomyces sp. NRRL WC-3742 TaxID=1463934 RepID=UPI00068CAE04|nr:hypothetical protein [Streptomyces sp. NRRL WC-3742]